MFSVVEPEYDDSEEREQEGFEVRMREVFARDPAYWLTFLIDGTKAKERPAVLEVIREIISFYTAGDDFRPSKDALRVLAVLADARALMRQVDLEASTEISRKTISAILKRLREVGLVEHPEGPRKGVKITPKGLTYVGSSRPH